MLEIRMKMEQLSLDTIEVSMFDRNIIKDSGS